MRPTDIARSHGNEPSKGAKIDEELQKEEEEYLKRKGKAQEICMGSGIHIFVPNPRHGRVDHSTNLSSKNYSI